MPCQFPAPRRGEQRFQHWELDQDGNLLQLPVGDALEPYQVATRSISRTVHPSPWNLGTKRDVHPHDDVICTVKVRESCLAELGGSGGVVTGAFGSRGVSLAGGRGKVRG